MRKISPEDAISPSRPPTPEANGLPWNVVSEATQHTLAQRALAHASDMIGQQAATLATDMEQGDVSERSGPEALRLLAAIIRMGGETKARSTLDG